MSAEATAVEIRSLRVAFARREVLRGIDLDVPAGRTTVVAGPSGSGKTTLLRAVNRLNECYPMCTTSGTVRVLLGGATWDVGDPALACEDLRRRASFVFQNPNPLPFSVRRNFAIPLRAAFGLDRRAVRERTERALREVGLWDEVRDRLSAPASDLSGGQQQRLCLARALALEPEILLVDEPTASLDRASAALVEDLLLRLRGRLTILAVSHSPAQARSLADRLVTMRDGRVEDVTDTVRA